ncbi:MAG: glutamine--fructose-6-phosphate transaminase (isomerizing) [Azospirillum sp.]|nr:MAG: glutamine--fructose-6-phosphate transaminase (isomerizing) [Azospirillum sp.]
MCGLVGYIGNNAVAETLLNGLKNLEYRGYDSAGIALNDNNAIDVFKAKGKLNNLSTVLAENSSKLKNTHLGIGHIRWATHGKATIENAHPHLSNDGKLVLVHNGIIENYKSLRHELESEGFHFHSETDTETAVHLIDREYKKCHSLEEAVMAGVKRLEGAFAFCIMHQDEPDKIIAVRKNAPLIIGLGKDENYIASDIPAIIGKVRNIIHLNDGELAVVRQNAVEVKNLNGETIIKPIEAIEFNPEVISRGGYKHFMLKEINEQPVIIRRMVQEHLPDANEPVLWGKDGCLLDLNKIQSVNIIACGTSLHAAMFAKFLWEAWLKIPVQVEAASEYIYRENITNEHSLVIGISQSGETADTITAVKQARAKGAQILIFTNREDSSIVRQADCVVPLKAGIEVSVAATKSYTAQLAALYWVGLYLAEQKNSLPAEQLAALKQDLCELPAKMEEILSNAAAVKSVADKLKNFSDMVYIGRGINLASALEGALKLKEISYINANGYAAGELKHGPIALLDENMPVMAVLGPGITLPKMISNCEEAKARNALLAAVVSEKADIAPGLFDYRLNIPDTNETTFPLLANIPLQLLAYYIADSLGREVDQPRNLAKSVTVE